MNILWRNNLLNIKSVAYIPLILLFLPAFCFFIGTNSYFPYLIVLCPITFIFIILSNKIIIYKHLKYLYKYTPFKYFIYLYLWLVFSGLIAVISGYYSLFRFLYAVIFGFIFRSVLIYLYPGTIIPKILSLKSIIRFFMFAYLLIFIWGLIEFIGALLNIEIINILVSFLSNIRGDEKSIIIESYSGIPRIRSVFMEPGTFGRFIAINMPIIYQLALCKFKIFQNKNINFFIKKSIIPLMWICLILTQSPIYLVICAIITMIFFHKQILFLIFRAKKILITITILSIILILMLNYLKFDISKSFLTRIISVIEIIPKIDIETLILVEPSLATRVVNNINQFLLFLKHPIFGIGFLNNGPILINQLENSPIPLTPEMYIIIQNAKNSIPITTNALYLLLFQTGIIGFSIYCLFMLKSIFALKKILHYFSGIEYCYISALKNTIITIFALSIIYNQGFVDEYLFFITGLVCSIVIIAHKKILKGKTDANE